MKELVRIKSFSNGLTIQLDKSASFDELTEEIARKFREGKSFFGHAAVAISFQGRQLEEAQEEKLLSCIEENCDLKVVCIVEKNEKQEGVFGKAIQHFERKKLAESEIGKEIQIFHGSLRDREELETPNSIIILGDVENGCSIQSEKSILVLGGLYGKAYAGKGEHPEKSFIAALEMAPDELYIGDFKYVPQKKSKWGKKANEEAMIASLRENSVLMEKLTKERLRDL